MPDPEEVTTGEDAQAVSLPSASDVQATPDDFDKERALKTIRDQREIEKQLRTQLKELEAFKLADKKRKDAELSELERTQAEFKALQDQHEQARTALRRATLKDAAGEAAQKANLVFAPGALADALALGVFDSLEWTDDGTVKGMGQAIKDLHAARPYLFAPPPQAADIGATNKGKQTKEFDSTSLAQRWGIKVG